ncbi:hypothetical protein QYM36_016417 [Artemia franciscana]|uniref:Uncharacterized protein n=1 Tax=Artemia franciscana TaxID=6661 RepID=A0AA88H9V7_ARTSF|nr:hypothetical protein QYM36_016417 [Artemia franciscana]
MNKKIPVDRFLHSSSLKNVSFKEKTILLKNEADQNLEGQEVEDKVKLSFKEKTILLKNEADQNLEEQEVEDKVKLSFKDKTMPLQNEADQNLEGQEVEDKVKLSFKEKTILLKNEADQNLEGQEVEDKVKLRKWREEAILFKQMVNTSLIDAVRKGDLKQAKGLIIDFGLSYSKEWSDGYALLREALINKHIAIVKLLLHNDCKINIEYGRCSDTPLHLAVIYGDIEVIKMILDKATILNRPCACYSIFIISSSSSAWIIALTIALCSLLPNFELTFLLQSPNPSP